MCVQVPAGQSSGEGSHWGLYRFRRFTEHVRNNVVVVVVGGVVVALSSIIRECPEFKVPLIRVHCIYCAP